MFKLLTTATLILITLTTNAQFCTPDDRFTEVDYFNFNELDSTSNAVYGYAPDHLGNEDTLVLDVFFPDNTIDPMPLRPAVMMMHGGAFQSGSKEVRQTECVALARRGFVVFNINYRIGWDSINPINQVYAAYRANQDARAAMRFIVENKDFYRVDTSWLFAAGSSAGAINAFHLTYSQQSEWNTALPGIELLLGNLNNSTNSLTHTYSVKGIFNNWGSCFPGMVQGNELIPTISFHGELDTTVPIDTASGGSIGSRVLHNFNLDNGICSDISVVPGGGHGVYGGSNGAYFRASKASCFFKSIFCDYCTGVYTTDSIPANCSQSTHLNELALDPEVRAYPNPFRQNLELENVAIGTELHISSIGGRVFFSGTYNGPLKLNHFESGVYLLQILDAKRTTLQIVKE